MNKQIAALATDNDNIVMWDIDALLLDYQEQPHISVETEILIPRNWLTIDTRYALSANIDSPLILFEIPDDQLYIADGNHRLYRAFVEKIPKMKVVIIPQDKHLSYLYKCDPETYYRVIRGLRNEGVFISDFRKHLARE